MSDESRRAANKEKQMAHRILVFKQPGVTDALGRRTAQRLADDLGLPGIRVTTAEVYTIDGGLRAGDLTRLAADVFVDPVLEVGVVDGPGPADFDFLVEVGLRPGVTDNVGRTARESVALVLGRAAANAPGVYTSRQYRLSGPVTRAQVEHVAADLLANALIQRVTVVDGATYAAQGGLPAEVPRVRSEAPAQLFEVVDLSGSDEALVALSRERVLALSLAEMRAIRDHYADPEHRRARAAAGLPVWPTDVELECLAQTWSEHCKHKIFSAQVTYEQPGGATEEVDSLFDTYIKGTTKQVRADRGAEDLCVSVFSDNAGVVRFTEDHHLVFKVETHNSPSALDPYGGALTGIVGVNRDPFGTGLGAELIFNTNVFCLADPRHADDLPPRLLHPRRVLEGVREGVEHGGNKSGIPTVNGSLVFDPRYLGKPLVYCGTGGLMPATITGRPGHEKAARPGDRVVMVGGRIGKDGIHGATFSSEELHEGSPATAVQIGDPITQKRMTDFLLRARDAGLYSAITDDGAGGLSSSIGEMARDPGGADLNLACAPLKYAGLSPWEVLLSEAQERMTVAVPPESMKAFLALAERFQVEATDLGKFDDSGRLTVRWDETLVGQLSMAFLHDGLPRYRLTAKLGAAPAPDGPLPASADCGAILAGLLGRLNVCSKAYWVRQYDHEVQGTSVVKPLTGARCDGPSDAAVIRPILGRTEGAVVSHGICPRYADVDAYRMAACAVDEAVRNAVAVGADPDRLCALDNFCWSDPVLAPQNPDGPHKLAQLVEACRALQDVCVAYRMPLVSGKDSMKNDYRIGETRIGIPPTLLVSVLGQLPDVRRAVTLDAKAAGDVVYVLGETAAELGASEYAASLGWVGASAPAVDAAASARRYARLHAAMQAGLVASCHDCSDGGLAVALAETAFSGDLGLTVDLDAVPRCGVDRDDVALFSESAGRLVVTVAPGNAAAFEAAMGSEAARVGEVTAARRLVVRGLGGDLAVDADIDALKRAWQTPLAY
jgi:phosphoribosylformylglycinamidine synthase